MTTMLVMIGCWDAMIMELTGCLYACPIAQGLRSCLANPFAHQLHAARAAPITICDTIVEQHNGS